MLPESYLNNYINNGHRTRNCLLPCLHHVPRHLRHEAGRAVFGDGVQLRLQVVPWETEGSAKWDDILNQKKCNDRVLARKYGCGKPP